MGLHYYNMAGKRAVDIWREKRWGSVSEGMVALLDEEDTKYPAFSGAGCPVKERPLRSREATPSVTPAYVRLAGESPTNSTCSWHIGQGGRPRTARSSS